MSMPRRCRRSSISPVAWRLPNARLSAAPREVTLRRAVLADTIWRLMECSGPTPKPLRELATRDLLSGEPSPTLGTFAPARVRLVA